MLLAIIVINLSVPVSYGDELLTHNAYEVLVSFGANRGLRPNKDQPSKNAS